MSPRLTLWSACRALAVRTRPALQPRLEALRPPARTAARHYADDATPRLPGANAAAKADGPRAEGAAPPDTRDEEAPEAADQASEARPLEGQPGEGDDSAQDDGARGTAYIDALDDATLEQILYGGRTVTSESQTGLTAAQEEVLYRDGAIPPPAEAEEMVSDTLAADAAPAPVSGGREVAELGHKFGLPAKPYPEGFNMKKRYHPVLEQITRLLMRDGKLSVAQRNMAMVMNYLRTAPAPIYSPKFPLLPGTPPASHLPLNPILYMTIAMDSVAPLLKVRNIAGAGGGGRALEMPVPLAVRQRRRMAFQWVLDAVNKKPSKGSGRSQLAHRIAEEIVAVVEGRSGVWEKRRQVHKLGTAARANVSKKLKLKKKK